MSDDLNIRPMVSADIGDVAAVHEAAFPRQSESEAWIRCTFAAYPRAQFFVAEINGEVQGYVDWVEKAGFRESVVLELEQIAVMPLYQGRGIGSRLLRATLPIVRERLAKRGASLKAVLVTTRTDNDAQRLY